MSVADETARLRLRPFVVEDAARLVELDGDPEVVRYVGLAGPLPLAEYEARIRRWQRYDAETPGFGYWAAEERATGAFLGWFHLRPAADGRYPTELGCRPGDQEIGYRLKRSAWGRGYATEMARHLVGRALRTAGVGRVVGHALETNVASLRVLEKAGLTRATSVRLPAFEVPIIVYAAAVGIG